jgi:hypothetical protein
MCRNEKSPKFPTVNITTPRSEFDNLRPELMFLVAIIAKGFDLALEMFESFHTSDGQVPVGKDQVLLSEKDARLGKLHWFAWNFRGTLSSLLYRLSSYAVLYAATWGFIKYVYHEEEQPDTLLQFRIIVALFLMLVNFIAIPVFYLILPSTSYSHLKDACLDIVSNAGGFALERVFQEALHLEGSLLPGGKSVEHWVTIPVLIFMLEITRVHSIAEQTIRKKMENNNIQANERFGWKSALLRKATPQRE